MWVCLELRDERSKDTDALSNVRNILQNGVKKRPTVCGGGTLECPPGVATSRRRLKLPFSATEGKATMACSPKSCDPESSMRNCAVIVPVILYLTSFIDE